MLFPPWRDARAIIDATSALHCARTAPREAPCRPVSRERRWARWLARALVAWLCWHAPTASARPTPAGAAAKRGPPAQPRRPSGAPAPGAGRVRARPAGATLGKSAGPSGAARSARAGQGKGAAKNRAESQAKGAGPSAGKGAGKGHPKSSAKATSQKTTTAGDGPSDVAKRRTAERTRLAQRCRAGKARKSRDCKSFLEEERASAERKRLRDHVQRCQASRKLRGTKSCKAAAAKLAKLSAHGRGGGCGPRLGVARRHESVAAFAKRHKAREADIRRWNDLGSARRLKGGRRYVTFRSPHDGVRLHDGVLLPPVPGVLATQRPERAWGRPALVEVLARAAAAVQRAEPRATSLVVGDLSKEGGGCLPPHKSHRGGVDVDVGYYHLGGRQRSWLGLATPGDLDADRTWQFLAAFLVSGTLQYAFIDYGLQPALYEAARRAGASEAQLRRWFQYPRPIEADRSAVIRHLRGHADHMHLRISCAAEAGACLVPPEVLAQVSEVDVPTRGRVGHEGRRRASSLTKRWSGLPTAF